MSEFKSSVLMFVVICFLPVFCMPAVKADVIQVKVWDRDTDPVIVKGSDLASISGGTISDYYVYSYQNGGWNEVVFQVDEMDSNPGWAGYTPNPFWNYFLWDDLDNGPDSLMGDGLFSNEDELVFMADALGDQVTADEWPAGAPTGYDRLELLLEDPLNPANHGWVYIFRYDVSPSWSNEDYVDWIDTSGTEKTIDAYGYSLSYISDGPGSWLHSPSLDNLSIKPVNGGDSQDLLDVHKNTVSIHYVIWDLVYCQTDSGIETYFQDETSSRPHYVWGVKDGPVRVIRQYRMRGQVGGSQFGYNPYYTCKYYKYSTHIQERFYVNTSMDWTLAETSFDHDVGAIPLTYRDELGNTGTIDGNSGNDSVSTGSVPEWVLVTSSHGSYHLTMDVDSVQTASTTNVWNDDGAGATEVAACQTANGRYGDFGYHWDTPVQIQNSYLNWYFTFLPDSTVDSDANGTMYHNYNTQPIPAPVVTEQSYISPTVTPTGAATDTPVPTDTPTETPIVTVTPTETPIPTDTPSAPTSTPTPVDTPTVGPSPTPLPVPATGEGGIIFMLIAMGFIFLAAYRRKISNQERG